MIIKGIKRSFICMSVILLTLSLVDGVTENSWESFSFQLGILLACGVVCLWQLLISKWELPNYFFEVFINFVGSLAIILILGKLLGWYTNFVNVGYVCVEVFIVFAISYFLGITKIEKEVKQINEMIAKRR